MNCSCEGSGGYVIWWEQVAWSSEGRGCGRWVEGAKVMSAMDGWSLPGTPAAACGLAVRQEEY